MSYTDPVVDQIASQTELISGGIISVDWMTGIHIHRLNGIIETAKFGASSFLVKLVTRNSPTAAKVGRTRPTSRTRSYSTNLNGSGLPL